MSQAPWNTTAAEKPYGFRVTIERAAKGKSKELHTFRSKTSARVVAVQAAGYKHGFLRLIEVEPLTREEWEREFGGARTTGTKVATS